MGTPMAEGTRPQVVRDEAPACVHQWVLSDPESGAITGRCKRCSGDRTFAARVGVAEQPDDDAVEAAPATSEVKRLAG